MFIFRQTNTSNIMDLKVKIKLNQVEKGGEANKEELQHNNSSRISRQSTWAYTYIHGMFHGIPQNTSFKVEIRNFKQEKHVKSSSSITPMSPFINSKELLWVVGWLKIANMPPNSKHQYLISTHHPIARLLIPDLSLKYAFCGRECIFCVLRQKYWVPTSRGLMRNILWNCFFL